MHRVDDPSANPDVRSISAIGSLLAATSGALVAVQVGLWVASRLSAGALISRSVLFTVLMSVGALLLGVVMFFTAMALLIQRYPASSGRRAIAWAGLGFVGMVAWAVVVPMLAQA